MSAHGMTVLLRRTPTQTAALCFTACPQTGVLRSSDDTLCNFARGLSPQRRWEHERQTASRHSAPLPVHELVFCGLLMTLSATLQLGEHALCVRAAKPTFSLGNGLRFLKRPVQKRTGELDAVWTSTTSCPTSAVENVETNGRRKRAAMVKILLQDKTGHREQKGTLLSTSCSQDSW